MSFEDGWAAMNLDMPRRVPRTEYSVTTHWALISAVTGIEVCSESNEALRRRAARAFMKEWNYDFFWSTLIGGDEFGERRTSMGHAIYEADGSDYDAEVLTLFADPESALDFDPQEAFGQKSEADLVRRFEQHYKANCQSNGDGVNMTGVYVTLMSGLIDLLGWHTLLLAAGVDLARFGALADRYACWVGQYFSALAKADVPIVMVHDDIAWTTGPFIAPEWYRLHIFPHYRSFFEPIVASGKKIIFTSDGNYTDFIDDIAGCGVHGFVLEPSTDMGYIAEKYGRTHVFIGNVDTRALLGGSREQIRTEVERCMDVGKSCPGYFMAVGNHIPPNTPVDAALYYNEVYERLCRR